MTLIQKAIDYPVTTLVGVMLLVLFGVLAFLRIPVQLTPNVEDPEVTVETFWPGASPQEIEREIVDPQEEQLKSLEGLVQMESSSSSNRGEIVLTFQVGTDLDAALLKVSNRLDQVPSYPDNAEKPVIRSVDVNANASAWFVLRPQESGSYDGDISTLFDFADQNIKPAFERVPGAAASNIFGGREREVQVVINPAELAARQVTLNELAAALDRENRNYSGGTFDEGKRQYTVRTMGEYQTPEDIEEIVVAVRNGVPVYVRDVAHAKLAHHRAFAEVFYKEDKVLAINVVKEAGANALDLMAGLREAQAGLNQQLIEPMGLVLENAYDETEYIDSAISLVKGSLLIGSILAVLCLLLYLRSGSSTLVVAVAIPISIVGTFLVMNALGRTINVISLAGLAFAAGMVVDNAIVVLENIYRHRQMGKSRRNAAFQGAREVWGAVLASTLTTIAVFVPVVFIEGEVGQLFGDIAIAISAAVGFSLLVSITVIPSLSARVLGGSSSNSSFKRLWGGTVLAERFNRGVTNSVGRIVESRGLRVGVIAGLTGLALVLSALLMPKTEYLPLGNQNFLFGILLPPPGYNLDEISSNNDLFVETMSPLWKADPTSDEAKEAPGGGIRNFFYVGLPSLAFLGASANDPLRVRELIPPLQAMNAQLPGTFFIINQSSIFSRGIGEGRSINIDFTGPDLNRLIGLGGETLGKVAEALPGSQARPIPSLDLGNPEVRVTTHRQRAAELGISNRELGFAVSALVDGAKASEYQHEGRAIDLRITTESDTPLRTHLLEQLPVATPAGELVTLGSLAKVEVSSGPVTINHRERQRAITIQVTPAAEQALEDAMDVIESDILAPMRDQGRLGGLYQAHLSGSADDLSRTWRSLRWNFLLALVITYLLMAALFENFVYPFVIMFSVPLAALGGFLGLAIMNLGDAFQPLDVLTMLGFIILVGTVVNNAILIVHQSLHHMRSDGMESHAAIKEAVSNRIRPIFMSVSTSVFGMLPLVLYPGAGSELYRGLGSVVVGGLVVSTVFTLFLVPALLSLMLDLREVLARSFRRRADDDPVAESS